MDKFFDLLFNFHDYLFPLVQSAGAWSYLVFFALIFAETGLIIFPYLPGGSLIFFASSIAAVNGQVLNIYTLLASFFISAYLGDSLNYFFGTKLEQLSFFKKHIPEAKLLTARRFFKRHGGKTIIWGRYLPLIRNFIPLIAGSIGFNFKNFALYNLLAVSLWVFGTGLCGYFFGRIPLVQEHFATIFLLIACLALIPTVFTALLHLYKQRKAFKRS